MWWWRKREEDLSADPRFRACAFPAAWGIGGARGARAAGLSYPSLLKIFLVTVNDRLVLREFWREARVVFALLSSGEREVEAE